MAMNRAQAAMEYLMTYGWALLVIVLVLGALIYLQVLNPQARLQDTCNLPIGFKCDVAGLSSDDSGGTLSLKISNQQAVGMDVSLACAEGTGAEVKNDLFNGVTAKQLSPGGSDTFTCTLENFKNKQIGEMANGEVFVKYNDGTSDKYVKGTFIAKVSQI